MQECCQWWKIVLIVKKNKINNRNATLTMGFRLWIIFTLDCFLYLCCGNSISSVLFQICLKECFIVKPRTAAPVWMNYIFCWLCWMYDINDACGVTARVKPKWVGRNRAKKPLLFLFFINNMSSLFQVLSPRGLATRPRHRCWPPQGPASASWPLVNHQRHLHSPA